jgi:hypothetical protein
MNKLRNKRKQTLSASGGILGHEPSKGLIHLHCMVPADAHRHAKALAAQLGMPLRTLLAQILISAKPSDFMTIKTPSEPDVGVAADHGQDEEIPPSSPSSWSSDAPSPNAASVAARFQSIEENQT